jgi:hypothetical protein
MSTLEELTRLSIHDHTSPYFSINPVELLAKSNHPTKAFETKLNIDLSTIFNQELGLSSISETRRGEGRPDILIYLGGLKILIEGSYSKQDAEDDVKSKIDRGFADVGIALHYKQSIPDVEDKIVIEQLRKSKFDIRIFTPKVLSNTLIPYIEGKERVSIAESKWEEYSIFELASLIKNSIYEVLIKEEFVANTIKEIGLTTKDAVGAGGAFSNIESRIDKVVLLKGMNSIYDEFPNLFTFVPVQPHTLPYMILGRENLFRRYDIKFQEREEKVTLKRR